MPEAEKKYRATVMEGSELERLGSVLVDPVQPGSVNDMMRAETIPNAPHLSA